MRGKIQTAQAVANNTRMQVYVGLQVSGKIW